MKLENFDEVAATFTNAVKACEHRNDEVAGLTLSFAVPAGYTRSDFISALFARKGTAPKKVIKDLVSYAKEMDMLFPEDTTAFCETLSFTANPDALECFAVDEKGPCGLVSLTAFIADDSEEYDDDDGEVDTTELALSVYIDLGSIYVAKDCRGKGIMAALVDMVGTAIGQGFEAALKLIPEALPVTVMAYGDVYSISGYKYAESFMDELGIQLGFMAYAPDIEVNTWENVSAVIDGHLVTIYPDIGD